MPKGPPRALPAGGPATTGRARLRAPRPGVPSADPGLQAWQSTASGPSVVLHWGLRDSGPGHAPSSWATCYLLRRPQGADTVAWGPQHTVKAAGTWGAPLGTWPLFCQGTRSQWQREARSRHPRRRTAGTWPHTGTSLGSAGRTAALCSGVASRHSVALSGPVRAPNAAVPPHEAPRTGRCSDGRKMRGCPGRGGGRRGGGRLGVTADGQVPSGATGTFSN